jgi:porin
MTAGTKVAVLTAVLAGIACFPIYAQNNSTAAPAAGMEVSPRLEPKPGIEEKAAESADAAKVEPLIAPDPLDEGLETIGVRKGQSWLEEHGVTLNLGITLVYQAATGDTDGVNNFATYSFDLESTWAVYQNDDSSGTVGFLADGGHPIAQHGDEDLSANIGSAFSVNSDADDEDIRIAELWYGQTLFGDKLTVVIGKIDQTTYLDTNRVANDETAQFLASPLLNNPSIAFPDRGLGFNATYTIDEQLYVSGGYGDAAANASENGFNTVGDGDWFVAGELGWTPTMSNLPGVYRLTVWGSGVDDENGAGVGLSADQEVAPGVVPFARLGYGDKYLVDFEFSASVGVGFENFWRMGDLLAVGAAWGRTGDEQSQSLVEAFYRFNLTESVAITPDLQVVFNPIDSEEDVVLVAGARLQATF